MNCTHCGASLTALSCNTTVYLGCGDEVDVSYAQPLCEACAENPPPGLWYVPMPDDDWEQL